MNSELNKPTHIHTRGMLTSTAWCLLSAKKTKLKKSKKTLISTYKTEKNDINCIKKKTNFVKKK